MSAGPPAIHFDPAFLAEPHVLFTQLMQTVAWDERMKARKTASFGVAYNYSQMSYPDAPMPGELAALCQRVERALGFLPNNCLLNHYADGLSTMGFHSDDTDELAPGTGVAIVSLGDVRSIVFRSKSDRSVEFRQALPAGSLLGMSQDIQHHWLHAIPKAEAACERISLTFRALQPKPRFTPGGG